MSNQNNVIDFAAARNKRMNGDQDPHYQAHINRMSKGELLEEMVHFQEERSAKGSLSLTMMVRGRILFQALEQVAETPELQGLASSYKRHLIHEIQNEMKAK